MRLCGTEDTPPSTQSHPTEAPATSTEDPPPSTQSHSMIGTITDTAAIVQDTDQVEETKEKEPTPAPEPPVTDNDSNKLQVPTASPSSRTNQTKSKKQQKKKAVSGMSIKAAKLQYLARQRANHQVQKQVDTTTKENRE